MKEHNVIPLRICLKFLEIEFIYQLEGNKQTQDCLANAPIEWVQEKVGLLKRKHSTRFTATAGVVVHLK
ncbi:MAG: hypothetical protein O7D30_10825 [Rickettsia endosymbiont of Ixodes persulcatus]|nr:hypothetical protein [Rickettsia endosymbiont of Ixodes persulcatus]